MEHAGETAVQRRLGVPLAQWGSARVGADIPPVAADFLAEQSMAVIGARDDGGAMWATLLTGTPGFLRVEGPATIVSNSVPHEFDPLAAAFEQQREVGMLAIDLATRRRMRVNGHAVREGDTLVIRPDQVYANCPKYIQAREAVGDASEPHQPRRSSGVALTDRQRQFIAEADTFFVATQADPMGADVSHRGGNPGFVTVTAPQSLSWPEYAGNKMYMTLGNLVLDARAGLLFVDWESGDALHLTGRATVDWSARRAATQAGAQQTVDFVVEQVVQIEQETALQWSFGGYSKFNPTDPSQTRKV